MSRFSNWALSKLPIANCRFLHPPPSARYHLGELAFGLPSQHSLSFVRIGHQHWSVARPPRSDLLPNPPSCDAFRGFDDFQNGLSPSCPQIERQPAVPYSPAASLQVLQRFHMRIGQIVDVDVVPNAGPTPESDSCPRRFATPVRSRLWRPAPAESGEFRGGASRQSRRFHRLPPR